MLDTSDHPNAEIAIKYRKDIQQALNELAQYLPEYESLVLNALEQNPQMTSEQLKQLCHDAHIADYYIYDQPELNEALVEVSTLGKAAVEAFKKSIEILGETADIELIKADLAERYGLNESKSVKSSSPATSNKSDQPKQVEINPTEDRDYESDNSNLAIGGASRENSVADITTTDSSLSNKDTQKTQRSLGTICRIHGIPNDNMYQLFKKLNIQRSFMGNDQYEYSTYDLTTSDLHEAIEYAEKRLNEGTGKDALISDETGSALQGIRSTREPSRVSKPSDESGIASQDKDIDKANSNIRVAFWAGIASLVITILMYLYALQNPRSSISNLFNSLTLVEIGFTAILIWGLHMKSRTAAVLMFVLFILNKFVMFSEVRVNGGAIIQALAFGYAYFMGIVGTFKYHAVKDKLKS